MPAYFHPTLRRSALTLMALGAFAIAAPSMAQTTVSGTFTHDDDKYLYNFNLATSGYYSFYTTSYAGTGGSQGVTNADGSTTAAGGFDPILTLFDGTGTIVKTGTDQFGDVYGEDDDQSHTLNADPTTGKTYDSYFRPLLSAGSYTLVVTEYDNFANDSFAGGKLADGFSEDGRVILPQTLLTSTIRQPPRRSWMSPGTKRTGDFTFNIAPATGPLPVPEASSSVSLGLLLVLGLGGFAVAKRRKQMA